MKRFSLLILAVILGTMLAVKLIPGTPPTALNQPLVTPNPKITKIQLTPDVPETLIIPKINVDAPVEQVGLDSQNRMDVPKTADDVGWYDLGVKPGQTGNAVIDGHLDRVSGAPAVFWNLKNLAPGDEVDVTDKSNHKFTYKVTDVESYPWNNFPLQKVFGSNSKSMLDLITCQGTWDAVNHNYSQRTVVYSELVNPNP